MRKTNSIEVVGIGNFSLYSITEKKKEYPKVNSNNEILTKKEISKSIPSKYVYVDSLGKEYQDKDVFVFFQDSKVQSIKKTEKVKRFSIVDRMEYLSMTEYNIYILDCDETTLKSFDREVKDKAISYIHKKSSVGFDFWKAYILKLNNQLVLITGKGDINKAFENFKAMKESKTEQAEITFTKLEVKADDLEVIL